MNACASCAISGVAVLPVPIAQTGSYARTRCSCACVASPIASTWQPQDGLGLAGLALLLGLADAGDHAQARVRAHAGPAVRRSSSVSPKYWRRSEWPTTAPCDAELEQHRRRDLAR